MGKSPLRIAITGAAGQIGYSLLFRIANGDMLGKDQPVILQLLEIPDEKAQNALKGVMMELDDCAFPLLHQMSAHSDPMTAFKDLDFAVLVGARPRGPGMERKDLLSANAQIFTAQGKALNAVAKRTVKTLVVGNPANTNAYIAMKSAPDIPAKCPAARRFPPMKPVPHRNGWRCRSSPSRHNGPWCSSSWHEILDFEPLTRAKGENFKAAVTRAASFEQF